MGLIKLGQLIKPSDVRNTDGMFDEDSVVGISTGKELIKTKADLNGVSLLSYKVLSPGYFAYVPDTSRRGDTVTGERQKIDYLGEDSVLGILAKDCWDPVIKVSATDNIIHITFRREKRNDPNLAANPQNEDFEYCINVVYKNGLFSRIPVTAESITKRGPWPKPGIPLPFGELTEADIDILYSQYGKEKVDEAIKIKEIYG